MKMKYLYVALSLFILIIAGCGIYFRFFLKRYDPLLVVVLMVKNEEAVIVPTVDRFVEGGVDAFLIFDTGSTDRTIETIESYFKAKHITRFVIKQEPFVDFSTSRNRALDLANEHFPKAGFFIMPDAEWYIVGADKLLAFCKQIIHQEAYPIYAVRTLYAGNFNDYDVDRLFRADSGIRFSGVVHESPNYAGVRVKAPREIYFEHNPSEYGDEKTHARITRDIALLEAEHAKNPTHARTLFYLAQSYMVIGNYQKAIEFFKKRAAVKGFNEEHFLALYRIAQMTEILENKQQASWQEAFDYYMQAYKLRPSRAEPLIHIAHYYLCKKDFSLAFDFAQQACQIPYPKDSLAINKELYETVRWAVLAASAEKLGHWHISYNAAQTALAVRALDDMKALMARVEKHIAKESTHYA